MKPSVNDLIPTEYVFRSDFGKMEPSKVKFCRMNSPFYDGEKWAVRKNSLCLNKKGEWEIEPTPSSRTNAFYKRCRFDSLETALKILGTSSARKKVSTGAGSQISQTEGYLNAIKTGD